MRNILKTIAVVTLGYTLSFSDTLKVTLKNIDSVFSYTKKNGELVYNNPYITDYSQVQEMTEQVYEKLTGWKELPGIKFLDAYEMRERIGRTGNTNSNQVYGEFYSPEKDSIYVKQDNLKKVIFYLAHGLGHESDKLRHNGNGLEGMIVEEAKAMAFSWAWTEELKQHIYLAEGDKAVGFINLGSLKFEKSEAPVHHVSDQLVQLLKQEKGTYKEAYETIIRQSDRRLLKRIEDNPTYKKLKQGKIRSKAYKKF